MRSGVSNEGVVGERDPMRLLLVGHPQKVAAG
jgi:hypothetical protein